jgi:hypothetical protein
LRTYREAGLQRGGSPARARPSFAAARVTRVGAAGFEPATSCSQRGSTARASRALGSGASFDGASSSCRDGRFRRIWLLVGTAARGLCAARIRGRPGVGQPLGKLGDLLGAMYLRRLRARRRWWSRRSGGRFLAWRATAWASRFRSGVSVVCTWRTWSAFPAQPGSTLRTGGGNEPQSSSVRQDLAAGEPRSGVLDCGWRRS